MPRRSDHGDEGLSEADRQGIAAIRREIDAEFGALEQAEPLRADPSDPSEPAPRVAREPRRSRRSSAGVFLLALVGGFVGGGAGVMTTLLWLRSVDGRAVVAAARPSADGAPGANNPAAAPRDVADPDSVNTALDDWLAATRSGDIERQMRFYPAIVPVYYTWRDVPRRAVRDEKIKVFGAASRLEIATDTPVVELADDGRGAVVRFRKRYVIEGPAVRRRGEVLQELRWSRTPDGWRIIAERDAEVLAP